eukprot:SAG31_NODE_4478_length_3200_cov_7.008062_5_plen_208_part_00
MYHDLNLLLAAADGRAEEVGYGVIALASAATPGTIAAAPVPPDHPAGTTRTAVMPDKKPPAVVRHQRLTISVSGARSVEQFEQRKAKLANYGVLACVPGDQTAFDAACTKLRECAQQCFLCLHGRSSFTRTHGVALAVDLIALDLGEKLPFHLKQAAIASALARGLFFEVSYAVALRDQPARRQLMAVRPNILALAFQRHPTATLLM